MVHADICATDPAPDRDGGGDDLAEDPRALAAVPSPNSSRIITGRDIAGTARSSTEARNRIQYAVRLPRPGSVVAMSPRHRIDAFGEQIIDAPPRRRFVHGSCVFAQHPCRGQAGLDDSRQADNHSVYRAASQRRRQFTPPTEFETAPIAFAMTHARESCAADLLDLDRVGKRLCSAHTRASVDSFNPPSRGQASTSASACAEHTAARAARRDHHSGRSSARLVPSRSRNLPCGRDRVKCQQTCPRRYPRITDDPP